MGYVKIWIHLVWPTKNREPILTQEIRRDIFRHIRENAEKKDIYIDHINGYLEHVHCLISLGYGQTIDKILNTNLIFLFRAKAQNVFSALTPGLKSGEIQITTKLQNSFSCLYTVRVFR